MCYSHIKGMTAEFQLQELLDEAGMSQSELARRAGIHFTTVSRLCRNASAQVSLNTLARIAAVLNVEPGDLIRTK